MSTLSATLTQLRSDGLWLRITNMDYIRGRERGPWERFGVGDGKMVVDNLPKAWYIEDEPSDC